MQNIDKEKFYDILVLASKSLSENKEYLNSLNVFPVPDGDTGTNMSATFSEAVRTINLNNSSTVEDIASFVSKGALMGARGNSGVILSQILRGFSKGLEGAKVIDVSYMVNALNMACESAYKAVMKPKEGTILTIIRAASESATLNKKKDNLVDFIDCVLVDTKNMLNATREMLPENKSAGTVDAGGAGLVVILQSFLDVLHGKVDVSSFKFNDSSIKEVEFQDIHPDFDNIVFQYCTEFIIKAGTDECELRERLNPLGDSIVVVSMDDITKVHIHTNEPGTAFNIAMEYGDLTRMKVDNMKEQSESNPSNTLVAAPKIQQAVIAVANGDGIVNLFEETGVTHVISGGQSMNPSVENIVDAINLVNAENVIILPNNKNIILSAEQAANIVDSNVYVAKSKTIPQGIAASIAFNLDSSFDDNCNAMSEAIGDVVTCQITNAVKDSTLNGLSIKTGDILGIKEDSIVCNSSSYITVIENLFKDCVSDDTSLVTVIYGNEIDDEFILNISSILEENYEDLDICFVNGKQDIYQFIIAFE